tara:strand:- start:166 stop:435 length:270 start_codon:yes stop_codon:yes gene_type:complete
MDNQKKLFSKLQSSFYKMINNIEKKGLNQEQYMELVLINNMISELELKINNFSENKFYANKKEYAEVLRQERILSKTIPYLMILNHLEN